MGEASSGVLVVDKPEGPTSHDVVFRVRPSLRTKRVGHAGTLDPMASGVLVVLVGEATKLEPYLSSNEKAYVAEIAFGRSTDTLDRLGATTEERAVSTDIAAELSAIARRVEERGPIDAGEAREAGAARIAAALEVESAREAQIPPRFSAIKVEGRKGYDRARGGEDFELAPRSVRLHRARIEGASAEGRLRLAIEVSKGYYVRALARDLGEALGAPAHLTELRRTRSGAFSLDRAVPLDADAVTLQRALLSLEDAARASLACETLTDDGVLRAVRGQPLGPGDFIAGRVCGAAWLDRAGRLVAIGEIGEDGSARVKRGFVRRLDD